MSAASLFRGRGPEVARSEEPCLARSISERPSDAEFGTLGTASSKKALTTRNSSARSFRLPSRSRLTPEASICSARARSRWVFPVVWSRWRIHSLSIHSSACIAAPDANTSALMSRHCDIHNARIRPDLVPCMQFAARAADPAIWSRRGGLRRPRTVDNTGRSVLGFATEKGFAAKARIRMYHRASAQGEGDRLKWRRAHSKSGFQPEIQLR